MSKRLTILSILCVAMLFPSIAASQSLSLFVKQKVVIADIIDKNDREINPAVKTLIYQGFKDVITRSSEYEVYEVNIEEIKKKLEASRIPITPENICKKIGNIADFVLFTEIRTSSSAYGAQAQNVTIFLSASSFRIKTATFHSSAQGQARADEKELLTEASALMARLLGIETTQTPVATTKRPVVQTPVSRPVRQQQSTPAPQVKNEVAPAQQVQPAPITNGNKRYKIGDLCEVNGKKGIVYAITDDGKHGKIVSVDQAHGSWDSVKSWCSDLGSYWQFPTKEELLAIASVSYVISQAIASVGGQQTTRLQIPIKDKLLVGLHIKDTATTTQEIVENKEPLRWHWSNTECGDGRAMCVHLGDGDIDEERKGERYYVRAVATF